MYYVYVLFSQKLHKRYIGFTSDLAKRLLEHNSGKSTFTKAGIPWTLLFQETFQTESEARKREIFLKSGIGRKFLDTFLRLQDAGVSASG